MVLALYVLGRKALSFRSRLYNRFSLSEKNKTSIVNGNTADKGVTKATATQCRDFQKPWKTLKGTRQKY